MKSIYRLRMESTLRLKTGNRLRLLAFPMRTRAGRVTYLLANHEISRFPFKERPHMPRSATTPGRPGTRVSVPFRVAFHSVKSVGARDEVIFAVQRLGLCAPLSTLRRCPHGHLRMTRGQCGSLLLHRGGLAPPTPCRSPGALTQDPMRTLVERISRATAQPIADDKCPDLRYRCRVESAAVCMQLKLMEVVISFGMTFA
jgi:hypothetical protein